MNGAAGRVADSTGNWVDRLAPAALRPYLVVCEESQKSVRG